MVGISLRGPLGGLPTEIPRARRQAPGNTPSERFGDSQGTLSMADIVLINPKFEVSYWGMEYALPYIHTVMHYHVDTMSRTMTTGEARRVNSF